MDFKCRHTGCERVFDSKVGRAVHERSVHGEVLSLRKTEFMCPCCENETYFDSALSLHIHLERYHGVPSESLDWIENRTFERARACRALRRGRGDGRPRRLSGTGGPLGI